MQVRVVAAAQGGQVVDPGRGRLGAGLPVRGAGLGVAVPADGEFINGDELPLLAELDPYRPATGVRGILAHVVTALGGRPVHGTAALASPWVRASRCRTGGPGEVGGPIDPDSEAHDPIMSVFGGLSKGGTHSSTP